MSTKIIKLPVEKLSVGVYVSKLDRPWIGTPFLFQGFTIETEEDLAELQRLCRTVYVEVPVADQEEPKPAAGRTRIGPGPPTPPDPLEKLSRALTAGLAPAVVKDSIPLRTELNNVTGAYVEAKRTVADVFHRLRGGRALDVAQLDYVVDWMAESVFRNRDAMSWLVRMKTKDDYLYHHSIAASVWAMAFGRHLGLDKETLKSVGAGAMLLDIGKTQLPTELLNASRNPTKEEWTLLRGHVEAGVRLASETSGVDTRILTMISSHHERYDGTGYPEKLEGESIQLVGRIAGIVDCYDAMTSARSYAKARSTFDAIRELQRVDGKWFQPGLVELFVQAVGVFPTGTLVELNTGEVGVVIAQNRFRRLRPEVMLILDAAKTLREDFVIVDLHGCEENNTPGRTGLWIQRGLEPNAYGIDPNEYFL